MFKNAMFRAFFEEFEKLARGVFDAPVLTPIPQRKSGGQSYPDFGGKTPAPANPATMGEMTQFTAAGGRPAADATQMTATKIRNPAHTGQIAAAKARSQDRAARMTGANAAGAAAKEQRLNAAVEQGRQAKQTAETRRASVRAQQDASRASRAIPAQAAPSRGRKILDGVRRGTARLRAAAPAVAAGVGGVAAGAGAVAAAMPRPKPTFTAGKAGLAGLGLAGAAGLGYLASGGNKK